MERYVGLDVHSKSSSYCIQDGSGRIVGQGTVPTSREGLAQLRDQQALPPGTPVALESGTNSFFAAEVLSELDLAPRVIDAREVRVKASRPLQKSDRRDAFELCDGLRRGIYVRNVWIPPQSIRRARETISRRRHFVRLRTSQVNAAKRLLRATGLTGLSRSLQHASGWEKLLSGLDGDLQLQGFVEQHFEVWLLAGKQVKRLEDQLKEQLAHRQPDLDRLMTVPGVGTIVASTFLAVVGDASRFPEASKVASYAGLVPSTSQSGERDHHGRITRTGSKELRSMLCEAAHHARRTTNPLHPFFTKVLLRRGYRMAIVAVAHRLCRMLYAIMRDSTVFDLGKAGVEEGRFEKVTIKRYRSVPVAAV